jgi:hypothetical protein
MTDQALAGQPASGAAASRARSGSETAAVAPSTGSTALARPQAMPTPTTAPDPIPSASDALTPEVTDSSGDRLQVELESHDDHVSQGGRVRVAGRVQSTNGACPLVRVDVVLFREDRTIPVGSLVTDEQGAYEGFISLPHTVPIGDYDLRVVSHGAADCRPATE